MSFTLVAGGVRSGKSAFALRLAQALPAPRLFIATAEARDDDMRRRIARHVSERGDAFATQEAPLNLPEVLTTLWRDGSPVASPGPQVVVVDCLTLWLSNLLLTTPPPNDAWLRQRIAALRDSIAARRLPVILVSNEVGMGVVPESALGRRFRDITGWAHQALTPLADRLYFAAMGCMVRLRPSPVAVEA